MHVDDLLITAINFLSSLVYSASECGNSAILNHDMAGSMIVKHIKFSLGPSLAFTVYGPMRSTHICFQGLASITSLYVLRDMRSHIFPIHDSCQSFFHSSLSMVH